MVLKAHAPLHAPRSRPDGRAAPRAGPDLAAILGWLDMLDGPWGRHVLGLSAGVTALGRYETYTIPLGRASGMTHGVACDHLRIRVGPDGAELVPVAAGLRTRTRVNGSDLRIAKSLEDADLVEAGAVQLRFTRTRPRPESAGDGILVRTTGTSPEMAPYPLLAGDLVVGSGERADVRLDDDAIADLHCILRKIGPVVKVISLGEDREVRVDGRLLAPYTGSVLNARRVRHDATIGVGGSIFKVSFPRVWSAKRCQPRRLGLSYGELLVEDDPYDILMRLAYDVVALEGHDWRRLCRSAGPGFVDYAFRLLPVERWLRDRLAPPDLDDRIALGREVEELREPWVIVSRRRRRALDLPYFAVIAGEELRELLATAERLLATPGLLSTDGG